jgi:hypothetical protein
MSSISGSSYSSANIVPFTPQSDPAGCWNLLVFQLADNIMTNRLWNAVSSDFTIV